MKVAQLWTYPVKSMIGDTASSVEISQLGIVGDRHWAVRDLERGGIRGAKKIGELMQFSATRNNDGTVTVTCPNGQSVPSTAADINDVLSAALGHKVALESLPDNGDLEHFRRGPGDSDDPMSELRGIFGREEHEPLPNFGAFPPEIAEFESPPGTHHDCWPLMIMTTSAMAALRQALPESRIDERRFRPSIVIDEADAGHPEFWWKGRTARLGTAEIEFLDPCPRCVMITRRINDDLPEDRAILRHVVRDLDQNVGVYARVSKPGVVSVGDELSFLN